MSLKIFANQNKMSTLICLTMILSQACADGDIEIGNAPILVSKENSDDTTPATTKSPSMPDNLDDLISGTNQNYLTNTYKFNFGKQKPSAYSVTLPSQETIHKISLINPLGDSIVLNAGFSLISNTPTTPQVVVTKGQESTNETWYNLAFDEQTLVNNGYDARAPEQTAFLIETRATMPAGTPDSSGTNAPTKTAVDVSK